MAFRRLTAVEPGTTRPCLSTLKGKPEVASGERMVKEGGPGKAVLHQLAGRQHVQGEASNRLKAQAD